MQRAKHNIVIVPSPLPLSIIIPVHNAAAYLPRCLDSITRQYCDFECLLVDDASTDSSSDICRGYAEKDRRCIILQNKSNLGSSLARKVGLDAARGDYILFVDADDWLEDNCLGDLLAFARHGGFDYVYCNYVEEYLRHAILKEFTGFDNTGKALVNSILMGQFSHALWNKLVKRNIYRQVIFPAESWGEDRYISIQVLSLAQKIGHYRYPIYHYRYHKTSFSNNSLLKTQRSSDQRKNWDKIVKFLKEKYGGEFNEFELAVTNYSKHIIRCDTWYYKFYDMLRYAYHWAKGRGYGE